MIYRNYRSEKRCVHSETLHRECIFAMQNLQGKQLQLQRQII